MKITGREFLHKTALAMAIPAIIPARRLGQSAPSKRINVLMLGCGRTSFDFQPGAMVCKWLLDLGTVKNVARVTLNGREVGVVWTAPWQVDVSNALKSGSNELVVDVANLWPNRLIGNAPLPKEQRLTATNVTTYDTMSGNVWGCKKCEERKKSGKQAVLLPSGLLGPVRVMTGE